MSQQPIEAVVSGTLNALAEIGFTDCSLERRKFPLQKILRMHEEHGSCIYDPALVQLFISEITEKYQAQSIGQRYYRHLLKIVGYLVDYQENGRISTTASYSIESGLNEYYETAPTLYCDAISKMAANRGMRFSEPVDRIPSPQISNGHQWPDDCAQHRHNTSRS